jgi:hypothetical protein
MKTKTQSYLLIFRIDFGGTGEEENPSGPMKQHTR